MVMWLLGFTMIVGTFTMSRGATNTDADILDVYPSSKGDGINVVWAHAVNSDATLTDALSDEAVMMLEADVILREGTNIPVMAHPPAVDSNLTLEEWLLRTVVTDKGMKLDFKQIDALDPAMDMLVKMDKDLHAPLWINADIVSGPNNLNAPVDPVQFIGTAVSKFPRMVLSLGWTTLYVSGGDAYTWRMMLDMMKLCYGLQQAVTFPVRAVWAHSSYDKWLWLTQLRPDFTVTVWHGANDPVNVDGLVSLRRHGDPRRIYYDLPPDLKKEFLDALEEGNVTPGAGGLPYTWNSTYWQVFPAEPSHEIYMTDMNVVLAGAGSDSASLNYSGSLAHVASITGRVRFLSNDLPGNPGDEVERSYVAVTMVIADHMLVVGFNDKGFVEIRTEGAGGDVTVVASHQDVALTSDCVSFEVAIAGKQVSATSTVVRCRDAADTPDNAGASASVMSPLGGETVAKLSVRNTDAWHDALVEDLTVSSRSSAGSLLPVTVATYLLMTMVVGCSVV
ncbi:PREDICTED: protein FAM151A-like [Priapulus caudatus]|uniref:Protein FAM151A-like n=1 Tax=Priapulus caudatus TaxID=37621 RepID=A0ABM1EMA9_PRICU|nr:PREDICTED: protein FAM151A-like [Priapulus caudatus]